HRFGASRKALPARAELFAPSRLEPLFARETMRAIYVFLMPRGSKRYLLFWRSGPLGTLASKPLWQPRAQRSAAVGNRCDTPIWSQSGLMAARSLGGRRPTRGAARSSVHSDPRTPGSPPEKRRGDRGRDSR